MSGFPLRAGLCLLLAAPLAVLAATPPAVHLEGQAYGADGTLLYRESHWLFEAPDGRTRLVLYRCPDGQPFARKWVRDHGQSTSPDFELDDARRGYREGVRRTRDGRREVFVQADADHRERSAPLEDHPPPVVDAGFDAFLHRHGDLATGASLVVPFLLPSRLGALNFKVQRLDDGVIDGQSVRRYRLSLASWIGFALPHLDLAYDAHSHDLLRFEGIANIRDIDGTNLKVRIVFPPQERSLATPAEIVAAGDEPLTGRCTLR